MENIIQKSKNRDSSIELFRIITMLIIVAHHYVVNSGLSQMLVANADMSMKNIFYWIFGWGGKTGINCFVFITGYFMCKSNISLKKFLKLFFEVEFYRILFFLVFTISGYQEFSITVFAKSIVPIFGIGTSFTPSFLVFFLFIPFLMPNSRRAVSVGSPMLLPSVLIFASFAKTAICMSCSLFISVLSASIICSPT